MLRFQKTSLVEQVADALRRDIEAGGCRGWLPTERQLCSQLRVSRRTLRCALEQLKQQGLVSAQVGVGTRVHPERLRRPAPTGEIGPSVGLLMPEPIDVLRPYVTLWIDLLKSELFEAGVSLRVHAGRQYFRAGAAPALRRLVAQHPHTCWVLALSNAGLQRWFAAESHTAVVAGAPAAGCGLPAVFIDSGALGRHIAGRMLALGHRRLVMFSEIQPSPGAAVAEQGFLSAIAASPDAQGEVLRPEATPAGYRRAVARLLRIRPRVTAVLSLNPLLGATVVTALMREGMHLPEDISFATTYGDPFMRFLHPEPTRYTYQPALFARKLARTVLQLARGEPPTVRHARLIPTFVAGETLGPAPRP
ncbi:MAG: GntR family transcriptional regulator [Verrucomicrobia bacterium]|jgi:DNA-binding LacI/PurR family transcriptional regulator|nr:GntR family transcriptional regulator [Verrucomicrobiota bacterium]